MQIANALARPFSSWNIAHCDGEPAYGYFARLVANEGHSSLRVYANEIGLKGRNLDPQEMLETIQKLPLKRETLESLKRYTPVLDGALYRIGDQTARQKQMSLTTRRWCRSCLHGSGHHRVWWDFNCYRTCPIHSEGLVERTVRDEIIRWYWPFFDVGPDGIDLAHGATPGSSAKPTGLERFIEGRFRSQAGLPLEGVPLHHVIDACKTLGEFLDDDGYSALLMGEPDLQRRLADRIKETVPEQKRRQGIHRSLGNLVYGGPTDETDSLRPWLERQFVAAFALVGRIGRKRFSHEGIERADYTLSEAADELAVPSKALSRFAKRLGIGLTPWKDQHSFSKEDLEQLRAKIADLITLPETIPITGIPGHEFRFLERAGYIESHSGLFPKSPAVRYLKADVVSLVERTLAVETTQPEGDAISLFSYAKRTGMKQGQVLECIFRGTVMPVSLTPSVVGFRRLRFATGARENSS